MDASMGRTAQTKVSATDDPRGLLARISAAFSAAVGAIAGITHTFSITSARSPASRS